MENRSLEGPAELPGCRDLDDATLRRILREAEPVELPAGAAVFRAGDRGDDVYFLVSGALGYGDGVPASTIQPGDLLGVMEALAGEEHRTTVEAIEEAELLRLPRAAFERLLRDDEELTARLVTVAERRLLREEVMRLLPEVFGSLDTETLHEMGRVFRWSRLRRGERLFRQGERGDALYVLVSGRLQARLESDSGSSRVVGEITPGETVGEMALVADQPRSATVVALRDSVLQVCDRDDFERLLDSHPQLFRHLAAVLVRRLEKANQKSRKVAGRMSIALVPLHDGIPSEAFARPFVEALETFGSVLHLNRAAVEKRAGGLLADAETRLRDLRLLPWFEEQESRHDVVVYEADPELSSWTERCAGQADRILLLADADRGPERTEVEERIEPLLSGSRPPVHLVLVHPPDRRHPRDTGAWLDARDVHRHHHVRRGRVDHVERVARLLTGRSIGVVLSGGGARGFAHIGVLQVFDELGVPVDAIGGTSAGAGMGIQYAMGHPPSEMREINRREFVDRRPFANYTLPVYSLSDRKGLDRASRSICGDLDVADLWTPFFCTTCDIHTGEKVVHERGPLWKAARATISLPGIVPPVVDGDRLLVDGGVLDNVPEQEMKRLWGGTVIVVDVSPGAPVPVEFDYEDMPSPWAAAWNRLNPFGTPQRIPGLLEVLVRTATVSNASEQGLIEQVADLVLRPPVSRFGMLEFGAIDSIVDSAVPYTRERLAEWLESRPGGEGE